MKSFRKDIHNSIWGKRKESHGAGMIGGEWFLLKQDFRWGGALVGVIELARHSFFLTLGKLVGTSYSIT